MLVNARKAKKNREMGVPLEGDVAFSSGWSLSANPHEEREPAAFYWIADHWRANAEAYDSFVHGLVEREEDLGKRIME